MTDKEYRDLQQKKFYSMHKQYKVYLFKDIDAEEVKILDAKSNKSAFIRKAIIEYIRNHKTVGVSDE